MTKQKQISINSIGINHGSKVGQTSAKVIKTTYNVSKDGVQATASYSTGFSTGFFSSFKSEWNS
jgi:hypothetical protein